MTGARRHIWLCADDYGISHGVNAAIRELVMRGRINATSVMVVAPGFDRADAASLSVLNADTQRAALGLHLTLSAPFKPLSSNFAPARNGVFLKTGQLLRASMTRRFHHETLVIEIASQLRAFITAFGRPPDFIDGHQHVHLFPQVRDALLKVVTEVTPNVWVRQCGRQVPLLKRLGDGKGLLLDYLSREFRRRALAAGVRTNPAFAGTYSYRRNADIARLFPRFLDGMSEGGVIMCHPGFVDAELKRLDPLTALREREFEYFSGEAFQRALAEGGVTLSPAKQVFI